MRRRHPRATRTDTLFPDTTLFRSAFAFLNVQHQGARNTRFGTAAADNRHLAAYTLVNARVGVSAPNWSVELFAENLGRSRGRSEEHTSELQSLMRISYAVFCLKKKITPNHNTIILVRHYRIS